MLVVILFFLTVVKKLSNGKESKYAYRMIFIQGYTFQLIDQNFVCIDKIKNGYITDTTHQFSMPFGMHIFKAFKFMEEQSATREYYTKI